MSDLAGTVATKEEVDVKVTLENVRATVLAGMFGNSEPWYGADIVITDRKPQRSFSMYSVFPPEPQHVVTAHVGAVSWLFEQVRDCFCEVEGYGFFKEGLFGELGDLVEDVTNKPPDISAQQLLLALLDLAERRFVEFAGDGAVNQESPHSTRP